MHRLYEIVCAVNRTHPGLGQMVAVNLLGAIARRCVLNVAVPGCGKSVTLQVLKRVFPGESMMILSLTKSSLRHYQKKFNGFRGLLLVDDLGVADTPYARSQTLATIAQLVYQHWVEKATVEFKISIQDFFGAAILNAQPVVLASMVTKPDWDAVVKDKCLRYYHLFIPKRPNRELPRFPLPECW